IIIHYYIIYNIIINNLDSLYAEASRTFLCLRGEVPVVTAIQTPQYTTTSTATLSLSLSLTHTHTHTHTHARTHTHRTAGLGPNSTKGHTTDQDKQGHTTGNIGSTAKPPCSDLCSCQGM